MTKHDQSLFIRVTVEDLERLDALADRISIVTRTSLAREAMRIGLDAIEANPALLVERPSPKRGGKRKGAGRKKRRPR